jgi:hypothetical protein
MWVRVSCVRDRTKRKGAKTQRRKGGLLARETGSSGVHPLGCNGAPDARHKHRAPRIAVPPGPLRGPPVSERMAKLVTDWAVGRRFRAGARSKRWGVWNFGCRPEAGVPRSGTSSGSKPTIEALADRWCFESMRRGHRPRQAASLERRANFASLRLCAFALSVFLCFRRCISRRSRRRTRSGFRGRGTGAGAGRRRAPRPSSRVPRGGRSTSPPPGSMVRRPPEPAP